MSEGSTVVPRVRARRKKRKPPGPGFWTWLGLAAAHVVLCVVNLLMFVMGAHRAGNLAAALLLAVVLAAVSWPRFLREWDAWRRDNDE